MLVAEERRDLYFDGGDEEPAFVDGDDEKSENRRFAIGLSYSLSQG